MVLVLGILSVVLFVHLFWGPLAWVLGNRELREIDAGLRIDSGRRKALIGRRLGMVGTFLGAAFFLVLTIALGAGNN